MQLKPSFNIVISPVIISAALRSASVFFNVNLMEEIDVSRRGNGSLNPLCTVLSPFMSVAAIPVVENGRQRSPFPRTNDKSG